MIPPCWFSQGLYRVDPASDLGQKNRGHDVNPLWTIFLFSCNRDRSGALLEDER